MKSLLLASLLLASVAHADTLAPVAECPNRICSLGGTDYLNASAAHGRVTAKLGDVTYDSGLYVVMPMGLSFSNVRLIGDDGSTVYVSAVYTSYVTASPNGKNRVTHWSLVSGEIQGIP